jgi:hypothetical protein
MNLLLLLKAGFLGFALSLGSLMLAFYVVGGFVRITDRNFIRVFMLAGVFSFAMAYIFLRLKIGSYEGPDATLFLAGSVGGWLSGIISGLTHMKRLLLGLRR